MLFGGSTGNHGDFSHFDTFLCYNSEARVWHAKIFRLLECDRLVVDGEHPADVSLGAVTSSSPAFNCSSSAVVTWQHGLCVGWTRKYENCPISDYWVATMDILWYINWGVQATSASCFFRDRFWQTHHIQPPSLKLKIKNFQDIDHPKFFLFSHRECHFFFGPFGWSTSGWF